MCCLQDPLVHPVTIWPFSTMAKNTRRPGNQPFEAIPCGRRMEKTTHSKPRAAHPEGQEPSEAPQSPQGAPGALLEPGTPLAYSEERSEERRVGKECRSRWSPNPEIN